MVDFSRCWSGTCCILLIFTRFIGKNYSHYCGDCFNFIGFFKNLESKKFSIKE